MKRGPDFIGLGAQKAGTSWIYACLLEHPQIFMPMKEAHFFSRERNWQRGYDWYETLFVDPSPLSDTARIAGEFSTTYLFDEQTPLRIQQRYPDVRLLVSLRNPVERALSNYSNDVMAGVVPKGTPLKEALRQHPEYVAQGQYAEQLQRYLKLFPQDQILILLYEEIARSPADFMRTIYRFLGVDEAFQPTMLSRRVNSSREPRFPFVARGIEQVSQVLQGAGLKKLWWWTKKSGLPDLLRRATSASAFEKQRSVELKHELAPLFAADVARLESILRRDLSVWRC